MVGHLVRKGGSVLAALTIVAGGAVMGAGTAAGQTFGEWQHRQRHWQGVQPGLLPRPCSVESFQSQRAGRQFRSGRFGSRSCPTVYKPRALGVVIPSPRRAVHPRCRTTSPPPPDVVIDVAHSTTRRRPVSNSRETYAYAYSHRIQQRLDSTSTVDPVTGDVTVTAPDGGWALRRGGTGQNVQGPRSASSSTTRGPSGLSTGPTESPSPAPTSRRPTVGWRPGTRDPRGRCPPARNRESLGSPGS